MIGRQEVPAEHLVGQSQVALEDWRHLGVEVFPPAELLQHLHGQHEDLTQALLLENERHRQKEIFRSDSEPNKESIGWKMDLEEALAAAVELHAEADAAGLAGAGELAEQSGQDGAGQGLLQHTDQTHTKRKDQTEDSGFQLRMSITLDV